MLTDRELDNTECFSAFLGTQAIHYGRGAAIVAASDGLAWLVILREKTKAAATTTVDTTAAWWRASESTTH